MTGRLSQVSPFQKRNKMLFKLFIGCVIILALLYYIGIILQCLFPSVFKITGNEISFLKAAIPFYYWIAPEKKIARAINADETDVMYAIEGWCSANGDPYKNQKLSEERAMAVFLELKRLGVDSTRLFIVGNGMGDEDSVLEQKVVVRKTF